MMRFIQQYALWRRVFKNRNRALRNALRDCGIDIHIACFRPRRAAITTKFTTGIGELEK